jgi:XrtJ-associated TM-motif-TM protein
MKKYALVLAVFALASVAPLYAQTGCGDSPENPTAILALTGAAGVVVAQLKNRWDSRGRGKQK